MVQGHVSREIELAAIKNNSKHVPVLKGWKKCPIMKANYSCLVDEATVK